MPGDYSRKTFRPKQHYSGVLMQQGRVQTDADWNEQGDIQRYRTETETKDVIGQSGVPKKNDGFKIGIAPNGDDLTIAAGRIYVGGLLCESDQPATYSAQPYLPRPEFTNLSSPPSSPPPGSLSLPDGNYMVFLDAWQREITALDDKLIREVALGGPDTTARLQNVWQVKLFKVGETSPPSSPPADCRTPFAQFDQLTAPSTGKLNARTLAPKPEENACVLPPSAGYNRLENQLYRVEIQTGGALNQATFKWSRDNASVETKIKSISGSVVKVGDTGKDEVLNFAGNQWVEIVDSESTLKSKPNALVQIAAIGPGADEITLKTSAQALASLSGLKLRRWDQNGNSNATADGVSATLAGWIDLEGGIQIQFSPGNYRAGDYWLIPARTATGEIEWPPYEIPNNNPIAQLPLGIRHHFCRLALIKSQGGAITLIEDCRERFPTLTEICAEDICFDNDKCDFAGAETVQDALDRLCSARDLRFHNKHLHGWGIVCGLQVECCTDDEGEPCLDPTGRPGRYVTVRPGYAIDCEGNDIILEEKEKLDLIDLIGTALPPSGSPPGSLQDGEVCLILEGRDKQTRFSVEPYQLPKNKWASILKGTLLADVFQDCIKGLIDFVKDEFTPDAGEEKVPVGPTQKRITTFSNLLIQLVNKQNGSFVFLSGEKGVSGVNFEDTILRNFYNKLREKLQSHTFCAMFDGARPFPEYPYAGLKIATIFGKGFQKRFRVSPNGKVGYSVGASNKINVYDLEKGEMVDELEFPGGTSAVVQDVALSADGKQLFAAATISDKDSFFAVADVSGLKHKFRKPAMSCDVPLVTLAVSPSSPERVLAIGKGKGLFEIDPLNVDPKPTPSYAFNAVGHMVIDAKAGMAFATASNGGSPTNAYDTVRRLNLKKQETPTVFRVAVQAAGALVPTAGEDDIALAGEGDATRLYAVAVLSTASVNKQVVGFRATASGTSVDPNAFVNLGENTTIRLAQNDRTNHMMVTYEDSYRVGLISSDNKLVPNFRHPVQISPLSIQVSPDQKKVYVLNYASNTISAIPATLLDPTNQIPLQPLVDYRADVLEAFADLLGGLIQYLKDCFCDHFLIDCPTCDEEDKLYLACVTIKKGQVFKICNFSLRKYVHSFPTVEYWLSVVPIIPLIKKAVETVCCAALPGFFGKFTAAKPQVTEAEVSPATNTLTSGNMRTGITFAQQTDFRGAVKQGLKGSAPGKKLVTDLAANTAKRALITPAGALRQNQVEGKPADEARKKLEDANITVAKVEAYDPSKAGRNLVRFTGAPPHLEPGMRVNLVTKDDKVLFYTLAEEPSAPVAELRDQVEATLATVAENKTAIDQALPAIAGLRNDVIANRATVAESKAALEKISPQVEELRARVEADAFANKSVFDKISPQLQTLQSRVEADSAALAESKATIAQALPQLKSLSDAVEANRIALDRSSPQLADLRNRVDATTNAVAENKASITEALGLREEIRGLKTELTQVRDTHRQELAARDNDIAELKLNLSNSQKAITTINERIRRLPPIG